MTDNNANVWNPKSAISADTKSAVDFTIAAAGQQEFLIKNFSYAVGTGALEIHKNGLLLIKGIDWLERTSTSYRLTAPATLNDVLVATAHVGITAFIDLSEGITTLQLISNTAIFPIEQVVPTVGFNDPGDGGNGTWKLNGVTGQTPSQSPEQLSDALLNDASGNQWALVHSGVINTKLIGMFESVTNPQDFISLAFNSANNVFVPSGVYQLSSRMVKTAISNFSLFGEEGTVLTTDPADLSMGLLAFNQSSNGSIHGLKLVGSRVGNTTVVGAVSLMQIVESSDLIIENNDMSKSTIACISIGGGSDITVRDNKIYDTGDVGVHLFNFPVGVSPKDCKIHGNTINETWGSAVVDNGINTQITNNSFNVNGTGFGQGIGGVSTLGAAHIYTVITNESNSVYTGNIGKGATGLGIDISDGRGGFLVDGNIITGARLSGIAVASPRTIVSNNICRDNGTGVGTGGEIRYSGIEVIARNTEINDVIITGNLCQGNEFGIQLQASSESTELVRGVTITGNNLANNTSVDINVINKERMKGILVKDNIKVESSDKFLDITSSFACTVGVDNIIPWGEDKSEYENVWDISLATRLTINKMTTKSIAVKAKVFVAVSASNTWVKAFISRNGVGEYGLATQAVATGQTRVALDMDSGPILASDDDYFEVVVIPFGTGATVLTGLSTFMTSNEL